MTGLRARLASFPGTPAPDEIAVQLVWRKVFARGIILLLASALSLLVTYKSWIWTSTPLTLFDGILSPGGVESLYPSNWLTVGHASITLLFLVTNLMCRRYGERLGFAHVLLSGAIVTSIAAAIGAGVISQACTPTIAFSSREVIAFVLAMTLGQAFGVVIFDKTRGVDWWNAPAYGALTASLVAMPVFYLLAYAGVNAMWPHWMAIDIALKSLMAFLLLAPYFALRSLIRPLTGLGGY